MTARIGYLAALASGPDGPLLRPPRRPFPQLTLADAEHAFADAPAAPEPLAAPEPAALPPAAVPAQATALPPAAVLPQPTALPPAAVPLQLAALPPGATPGPVAPVSVGPAAQEPVVPAPGRRGQANGVVDDGTAGRAADEAPGPPGRGLPAGSPHAGHAIAASLAPAGRWTPPGGKQPGHPELTRADSAAITRSSTIGGSPAAGPDEPTAPSTVPSHPAAAAADLRARPSPADSRTTRSAAPPVSTDLTRADPAPRSAVLNRADLAAANRPGPAQPAPDPGAAVSRPAGLRAGPSPADSRTTRSAAPPVITDLTRADPAPQPASVSDGRPSTVMGNGGPARSRRETNAARTPAATLSIGTIEITVLPPPRDQKSPAPPGPRRAAPAGPPDRLSRGLGPWFGRDQA